MLSAVMEKADNIQEQMGICKQRGGNYKKESEGNVRTKICCNKNEECLWSVRQLIRMSDDRIKELEHRSIETSEWNAKRKKEGKHRTEYPRPVGSFQKVFPMHGLGIPEGEARTRQKKYLKLILVYVVVQSLSCVWLFATPWTAAHQVSLSITISWSLLKLMSI